MFRWIDLFEMKLSGRVLGSGKTIENSNLLATFENVANPRKGQTKHFFESSQNELPYSQKYSQTSQKSLAHIPVLPTPI